MLRPFVLHHHPTHPHLPPQKADGVRPLPSIRTADEERIALIEIIPGRGSGKLKDRVLKFLNRPEIKWQYHRIEKDSHNFGRLFVHFRR